MAVSDTSSLLYGSIGALALVTAYANLAYHSRYGNNQSLRDPSVYLSVVLLICGCYLVGSVLTPGMTSQARCLMVCAVAVLGIATVFDALTTKNKEQMRYFYGVIQSITLLIIGIYITRTARMPITKYLGPIFAGILILSSALVVPRAREIGASDSTGYVAITASALALVYLNSLRGQSAQWPAWLQKPIDSVRNNLDKGPTSLPPPHDSIF